MFAIPNVNVQPYSFFGYNYSTNQKITNIIGFKPSPDHEESIGIQYDMVGIIVFANTSFQVKIPNVLYI